MAVQCSSVNWGQCWGTVQGSSGSVLDIQKPGPLGSLEAKASEVLFSFFSVEVIAKLRGTSCHWVRHRSLGGAVELEKRMHGAAVASGTRGTRAVAAVVELVCETQECVDHH